ncbi:GtrA family protein [Halocalculus aciditolerans]|uniref:GtrA/DPMS transmembrane domain-containing protein n=1 Tax=Halocalculus aciditolerans TaxID=1383812 RepID=A0A830FFW5_9EURY|nr:GtrA family protein [Halocalculus aciditolerans]GGL70523.1 hypothetical protein GCM10009039_30740 [Halocalculus aciditolerans]
MSVSDRAEAVADTLDRTGVASVSAERLVRLAEFGAVGASGAVVNLVVFLFVASRIAFFLAGFVAFFGGVLWTFALNWVVTFRDVTGELGRRFVQYVGVCCVGYAIYTATLTGAVAVFHLPYWLSGLGAISTAGVWNFLGSERYALA